MSHTVSGQTTSYAWDVASGLPVVLQDGANTYVHGLDLISSTDAAGAQTYLTYDGLGSTTDLTDASANVTGGYAYDAFGAIRSQTGGGSNFWQFTGEQRDADSGLYFLRARYYDPVIGRFLGEDPLPHNNLYTYVGNSPANFTDRSGLCFGLGNCGPIDDVDNTLEDAYQAGDDLFDLVTDSYYDLNFTPACFIGVTLGVQISWDDGVHPYGGLGVTNYCGLNANLTMAPNQSISEGWGCGAQYGVNQLSGPSWGLLQLGAGPTVQGGAGSISTDKEGIHGTGYWEIGVGGSAALSIPGLSIPGSLSWTCYYVFPDILPF